MKRATRCLLGAIILCAGLGVAAAQEMSEGLVPPPKVLLVDREYLKPGKWGAPHEKAESAFVQAFTRAKWPTHYFAVTSLTGRPRVLFLVPYDSFDAIEKDNAAVAKNAVLSSAIDRASAADGDLLSEQDASMLIYNEDQSMRAPVDIAHMRYFEIGLYRVKAGHRHDWEELIKLYKSGYEKISDVHWATFEAVYGQEGTTFVVFQPLKSMADVDAGFGEHDKQFAEALGEDGMKRLDELTASSVEFSQTNLFQFAPAMSYAPDSWVKTDPDFWKVKGMGAPVKVGEKPAEKK